MAGAVSREAYFQTGLDLLSDQGYGGLKLAEVCNRLGVTTGSFYHYFSGWPAYTRELLENWMRERTVLVIEFLKSETDPRTRIDRMIEIGLELPHGAEAAIRAWSSLDPDVYAIQVLVDQLRYDILYSSALEIVQNHQQAEMFARWAVYLLVGYEQATLPRDTAALAWIARQLTDALDSGRFASFPTDD